MISINKCLLLALVASVLVGAALAADGDKPASPLNDGVESTMDSIRGLGSKVYQSAKSVGGSILSHIPIVNRLTGSKQQAEAGAGAATEASASQDESAAPAEEAAAAASEAGQADAQAAPAEQAAASPADDASAPAQEAAADVDAAAEETTTNSSQ